MKFLDIANRIEKGIKYTRIKKGEEYLWVVHMQFTDNPKEKFIWLKYSKEKGYLPGEALIKEDFEADDWEECKADK